MARVKQSLSLSAPSPFHHEAKWVICFLSEGSKTTEQSNSCLLVHSLSPSQNLTAEFFQLTDSHSILWLLQLASVLLPATEFLCFWLPFGCLGLIQPKNSEACFPGGASGKEPICQCRRLTRHGFNPWVRKIPWKRKWKPTSVILPGESHGQRSLMSYRPWGLKKSDTTEVDCAKKFTF